VTDARFKAPKARIVLQNVHFSCTVEQVLANLAPLRSFIKRRFWPVATFCQCLTKSGLLADELLLLLRIRMSTQVSNALWLILALIPSALWLRGVSSSHGRHWRRLLGLVAALGVMGFVFSVVSPDDDSIQQVFTQSRKTAVQAPVKDGCRGGARITLAQVYLSHAVRPQPWTSSPLDVATATGAPAIVLVRIASDRSPPSHFLS
jgi:uncharacterized membrane protein